MCHLETPQVKVFEPIIWSIASTGLLYRISKIDFRHFYIRFLINDPKKPRVSVSRPIWCILVIYCVKEWYTIAILNPPFIIHGYRVNVVIRDQYSNCISSTSERNIPIPFHWPIEYYAILSAILDLPCWNSEITVCELKDDLGIHNLCPIRNLY